MSMLKAFSVLVQDPDWDNIGELIFAKHRNQAKRLALKRNGDLREAVNEGAFLHIMRHKNVDHIAQKYSKPVCVYSVEIQRQCGWLVEGDAQCATCGLYSMDGIYEVCENCHNCIECKCDDGCE